MCVNLRVKLTGGEVLKKGKNETRLLKFVTTLSASCNAGTLRHEGQSHLYGIKLALFDDVPFLLRELGPKNADRFWSTEDKVPRTLPVFVPRVLN